MKRQWLILDPKGLYHVVQYVPESAHSYYSEDGFWGAENLPEVLKQFLLKELKQGTEHRYFINGYEIKETDYHATT